MIHGVQRVRRLRGLGRGSASAPTRGHAVQQLARYGRVLNGLGANGPFDFNLLNPLSSQKGQAPDYSSPDWGPRFDAFSVGVPPQKPNYDFSTSMTPSMEQFLASTFSGSTGSSGDSSDQQQPGKFDRMYLYVAGIGLVALLAIAKSGRR